MGFRFFLSAYDLSVTFFSDSSQKVNPDSACILAIHDHIYPNMIFHIYLIDTQKHWILTISGLILLMIQNNFYWPEFFAQLFHVKRRDSEICGNYFLGKNA
jgi:hypothetical protein